MSRRALKVPSYCLHRASGRAVVRLGGRDVYLGQGTAVEETCRTLEITVQTYYRWRLDASSLKGEHAAARAYLPDVWAVAFRSQIRDRSPGSRQSI